MNLPLHWQDVLRSREPDLDVLVTVNPYGIDPMGPRHLAMEPGSVRLATTTRHVDGRPFWGWVREWPAFSERYAPHDRRAEISETTVAILGGADLAATLLDAGGGQRATCRIDLWSPRLESLAQALPMVAGPVRNVPRIDDRNGPVEITVTDGDPDRVVEYPPGTIELDEFPDAPERIRGAAQRQVVLGPYPYQIPCPQIDADGLRYYVHEGWGAVDPTEFFSYGSPVTAPSVVRDRLPSGLPVTVLEFSERPSTPDGLLPAISCAGGVGLVESHPALFLLETIGGYRLTPRARHLLAQSDIDFGLLLNARGDVRQIVAQQLIPQTDLVQSFRHGVIDVFSVRDRAGSVRLGVGAGLLWRHATQDELSPLGSVFNDFEIRCGRNAGAGGGSLVRVRRSPEHGGAKVRALLGRSQRVYGRHAATWDALDLAAYRSPTGEWVCPAGEILGDVLAQAHALPYRSHGYRASWLEGLSLDLAQRVRLTEGAELLDETECVVTRRDVTPTGVDVWMSTALEPARTFAAARTVWDA